MRACLFLADALHRQAMTLGYFPIWSYAHPRAIELAERLASLAPGKSIEFMTLNPYYLNPYYL